jgi:signal transduction histidine kinase
MFNIQNIYNFVGDTIYSAMGLRNINLLSAVPGGYYQVVYSKSFTYDEKKEKQKSGGGDEKASIHDEIRIDEGSDSIQYLKKSNDIVIKGELDGMKGTLGPGIADSFINTLKPFNGEAVMPVFVDDKLEVLFILGDKLSGDIFTEEDIKLIGTISHQTSIAIKNARLYTEKLSSERLASIGMMSATFAHEVRNPLTSIKTFAQLMPEKYKDSEFRESFSKLATDEIDRIDRLIKDLMSFSSEHVTPPNDILDITALVDKSIERVKSKLEIDKKHITVEKLFKKDTINVLGDRRKLQQSLVNIMNNGCQAMGDKGVLTVDIIQNGLQVNVGISDTGKGIPPQDITRVFDPFYTTRTMGLGLGLAISKKIIEDHGGTLGVESTLFRGTTFTATLPVKEI